MRRPRPKGDRHLPGFLCSRDPFAWVFCSAIVDRTVLAESKKGKEGGSERASARWNGETANGRKKVEAGRSTSPLEFGRFLFTERKPRAQSRSFVRSFVSPPPIGLCLFVFPPISDCCRLRERSSRADSPRAILAELQAPRRFFLALTTVITD
jgi:hypothetical protein